MKIAQGSAASSATLALVRGTAMRWFMIMVVVLGVGCDAGGGDDGGGLDAGRDTGGSCQAPMVECPGSGCVNTGSDVENCGSCGNACGGCDRCIMGSCTPACCGVEIDCDPSPTGLDCVDPEGNRIHCGYCDNTCADDEICYRTGCVACEAPDVRCNNRCVDLQRDIENCGECGHVCERMYCQCGLCVPTLSDAGCE